MKASSPHRRHTLAALVLIGVAGCGGDERQDENEAEGNFRVEVVDASFPERQRLAQSSVFEITLRNAGSETIPNVAVTVNGFGYRKRDEALADPVRPRFAVNGIPRQIGTFPEAKDATPAGCDTAYVNTWACGPLKPDGEKTMSWSVTAVKSGPFAIRYRVDAGLDGKAKAVDASRGGAPRGVFTGTVSNAAAQTRVADDGKTVVTRTP